MKSVRTLSGLLVVLALLFASMRPGQASLPTIPTLQAAGAPIQLKAATFWPGRGESPALPAALHASPTRSGQASEWIVQFGGPVRPEWKTALLGLGAELLEYIPEYAFRVRMAPEAAAHAGRLAPVAWVGPFHPAYKIDPAAQDGGLLRVELFPGADSAAACSAISALGLADVSWAQASLTARLDPAQAAFVAGLPGVRWIEPAPEYHYYNNIARGGGGGLDAYALWALGVYGAGQVAAVADSGLDNNALASLHPDFRGRVVAITPASPLADEVDWIGHGTHVAGSLVGSGAASGSVPAGHDYGQVNLVDPNTTTVKVSGMAPEAQLYFQVIGCLFGLCLPEDLNDLFAEPYAAGARIHSNSWGSNAFGEYRTGSSQVDAFVWSHPDLLIAYAAGNSGIDANNDGWVDEDSLGAPATAKNALSVGAIENARTNGGINPENPANDLDEGQCEGEGGLTYNACNPTKFDAAPTGTDPIGGADNAGQMMASSSRGPTDDGRIKPDLVAPGANVLSTRSRYDQGCASTGGPTADTYCIMSGTSMATPLAAGAALLVRDWYAEVEGLANPSAALLKATLINTAVDISGYGDPSQEAGQPIPNFHEGWGRINLANVAAGGRRFFDSQALSTGETFAHTFNVTAGGPFKVTLAWSDYPASPGAARTLVNDLDLVVSGPGGVAYLGNIFAGGWSQAGGTADTANNVENVYLPAAAGEWTVEVRGANVPYGPQPFALLVAGAAPDLTPGADRPPSAAVADPQEGQVLSGVYRVKVLAGDDAGLSRVELSFDGGAPIDLTASLDGAAYGFDWNTAAVPDGAHTLRARAFDGAGQFAASALVTVQVKNAAAGSLTWLPVVLHNLGTDPAP